MFKQAQRKTCASRGGGQAFKLTAGQAEASEEVVAGTILVHSVLIISLFDSGTSYYCICTRFVIMHYVPSSDMDT